jgi:hypothetical protein
MDKGKNRERKGGRKEGRDETGLVVSEHGSVAFAGVRVKRYRMPHEDIHSWEGRKEGKGEGRKKEGREVGRKDVIGPATNECWGWTRNT